MRTAHRGPTLIALRARREALEIARDVVYPHLEVPSTQLPLPPLPAERIPSSTVSYFAPFHAMPRYATDGGPAPRWMWGLLAGCLAFVGIVGYVILHGV